MLYQIWIRQNGGKTVPLQDFPPTPVLEEAQAEARQLNREFPLRGLFFAAAERDAPPPTAFGRLVQAVAAVRYHERRYELTRSKLETAEIRRTAAELDAMMERWDRAYERRRGAYRPDPARYAYYQDIAEWRRMTVDMARSWRAETAERHRERRERIAVRASAIDKMTDYILKNEKT